MRKAFAAVVLCAVAVFGLGASAFAADTPSAKCSGAPVATGTDGDNSASVCIDGLGAVTGAQKGDTSGYVVVDGDNDNPLTAASQCLDGHIAIQVVDGTPSYAADDGEVEPTVEDPDPNQSYVYPAGEGDPIDPAVCAP